MFFNPEIERRPKLRQNGRLQKQGAYVYDRVPFYKARPDAPGMHPSTFKGFEQEKANGQQLSANSSTNNG